MRAIAISILLLGLVSCKTAPIFGPQQCRALANLADSVWVQLSEVYNEDNSALVSVYSDIGKDLAAFGCAFVPDPLED